MTDTGERLVHMANQIATAFRHQQPEKAAAATYDHIWHFWDPRMRARILAYQADGGDGLNEIAATAVKRLVVNAEPPPATPATDFSPMRGEAGSDAG